MTKTLLVAGSNSGCQLGVGHDQDVWSLEEALCRAEAGSTEKVSFPPAGYAVVDISSGANHTLALLRSTQDCEDARNEIWVAGTGSQGQLGPAHASSESEPLEVFTRLDLETVLEGCVDLEADLSDASFEPKRIVCGWNCSYIVLKMSKASLLGSPELLLSLGLHRDNTFGELGCAAGSMSDAADSGVHRVSFSGALIEAGLDVNARFEIVGVAAGLRHAVAALSVQAGADGKERILVVGWGSARQGQVGRIPEPPSKRPGSSKRPGPAAAIVWQPQLISKSEAGDPVATQCRLRAGRDHTVVLLQENGRGTQLLCYGSKKHGQLLDTSALRKCTTALDDIVDVTCNWNSTLLLIQPNNGEPGILSCGSNSRGQLGIGDTVSKSDGNSLVSADLTAILRPSSSTSVVHTDAATETPPDPLQTSTTTLRKLVSGSEHSLLLVTAEAQQVWGWGWNEHGNLAQGPNDQADRHRPTLLLGGTGPLSAKLANAYTPLDVWAGFGTSFILAERHGNAHTS